MARQLELFLLSLMTLSLSAHAVECSNSPTEDEKRLLCAGESHPLALKLCSETLTVTRDRYGRVVAHSYKADATLPEMALLSKMCDASLMPDKSEKAVGECRSTMRVKVSLEGKPVGYSYRIGGHNVDMLLDKSGVKQVGDGGYLCKNEPANTMNRKVCMDDLNFAQDGDYITTYTQSAISNFPTDDDAKSVCKGFKEGSKDYQYCQSTAQVYKDTEGKIIGVKLSDTKMSSDFKGLDAVCDKPVATAIVPKIPEIVPEVREEFSSPPAMQLGRTVSSKSKCEGLSGSELTQCISGATGETTVLNFDGCKAVWGARTGSKGLGERPVGDQMGQPPRPAKVKQE